MQALKSRIDQLGRGSASAAGRLLTVLLAILLPLQAGALELGRVSMARRPGIALRTGVSAAPAFFRAVGGVAFSGVAKSKDKSRVVDVFYDAQAEDGLRLRVALKTPAGETRRVRADVPDWMLLPLVKYASSKHGACVTMFGKLQDQEEEAELREDLSRIVNYHPAFDNTLLGLRLLQADMMLLTEDSADLPKEGGAYLLGIGETPPNLDINRYNFARVEQWLLRQTPYSSYVIGDHAQNVYFWIDGDRLQLSGDPYWQTWRMPKAQADQLDEIYEQIEEERIRDVFKMSSESLRQKYSEAYIEKRVRKLSRERGINAEPDIEQLPGLSVQLTLEIERNHGINPAVYKALRATMQVSAFLRHVKQNKPEAFARLLQQVEKARIPNYVETPTVLTGF